MKILVTGAKGFVGKNLCWALKNIKDGKDRRQYLGQEIEKSARAFGKMMGNIDSSCGI